MVILQATMKVWANGFWLRCATRGFACALALFCLSVCANLAQAQQASTPLRPMSATATTELPAKQTQAQTKAAATAKFETSLPVIAVVHRLSGWRLRALLTRPGG